MLQKLSSNFLLRNGVKAKTNKKIFEMFTLSYYVVPVQTYAGVGLIIMELNLVQNVAANCRQQLGNDEQICRNKTFEKQKKIIFKNLEEGENR